MTADAEDVVAGARGDINQDVLTSTGSGGVLRTGYLHDKPAIEYLRDDEQLLYLLHNKTGITVAEANGTDESEDGERTIARDGGYRAIALVTSERVVFLCGREGGDEHKSLSMSSIEHAAANTGLLNSELVVWDESRRYSFRSDNKQDVRDAAEYIDTQARAATDSSDDTEPEGSSGTDQSSGADSLESGSTELPPARERSRDGGSPKGGAVDDTSASVASTETTGEGFPVRSAVIRVSDTGSDDSRQDESGRIPGTYDHAPSGKPTDADPKATTKPQTAEPPAADRSEAVESALSEAQKRVQALPSDLDDIDSEIKRLSGAHQLAIQAMREPPEGEPDDEAQQLLLDIEARLEALATARTAIDQAESLLTESDSEEGSDDASEVLAALATAESAVTEYGVDTSKLDRLTSQVGEVASIPSDEADGEEQPLPEPFVEELQRLKEELGKIPSYTDMRNRGQCDPRSYYDYVDSWGDALAAAGLDIQSALTEDLQSVAEQLDRQPTVTEKEQYGTYSPGRYQRHFDSWEAALDAAGMATSEETLLDVLRQLREDLNRIPNATDIREHTDHTINAYTSTFGSLKAAYDKAGLEYEREILTELQRITEELGRPPKTTEFTEESIYSANDVYKLFDSWDAAIEKADEFQCDTATSTGEDEANDSPDEAVLLENLRRVYDRLNKVPSERELRDIGEYPRQDYTNVFGSWYTAVERAGIDYEQEIIDELQRVGEQLRKPPTTVEFNEEAIYSAGVVYNFFDSWSDARRAAEVDEVEPKESHVEPSTNALAEYYELFNNLRRLQNALYGENPLEQLPDDDPMAVWIATITDLLGDGLDGWEDGYGPQQRDRNPHSMQDYREAHGDGSRITEFELVDTAPAPTGITALVPEDMSGLPLPVAPESGRRLPVIVEDETELQSGIAQLKEFPATPDAAASPESSPQDEDQQDDREDGDEEQSEAESNPDHGTESEDDEQQESDGDEALTDINGINEPIAKKLRAAGYTSREQLADANMQELREIGGVNEVRGLRIKSDVGG